MWVRAPGAPQPPTACQGSCIPPSQLHLFGVSIAVFRILFAKSLHPLGEPLTLQHSRLYQIAFLLHAGASKHVTRVGDYFSQLT